MKTKLRILSLLMLLALLFCMAAACDSSSDPTATPDGDGTPDANTDDANKWQPPDNFGGRQFIIADWWTPVDAPVQKPKNVREEQIADWRYILDTEYGFSFKQMTTSSWGDYTEIFIANNMAGTPDADLYMMAPGWAQNLMDQGLLFPLNTLDSFDPTDEKWSQSVIENYTKDGNIYAFSTVQYPEARRVIYFNKRLFAEAGLDPDLPYDLQAKGEWTWDTFLDVCKALTRDLDGDGLPDVYAFCGFAERSFQGFIYSNNGKEIGVGPDMKFYNAMLEPEFIEAMQFMQMLWDEAYWYDGPPDKDPGYWNWFDEGWETGIVAMKGADPYEAPHANQVDEWGMVFFPMGPKATDYRAVVGADNNVLVLPSNISKDRAEEIMYAYNLWTQPVEYDLENPDAWKYGEWGYDRFNDSRAVDETMAMIYSGKYTTNARDLVSGIDWGPAFDWGNLGNQEMTPIEKIQQAQPIVDAAIAKANGD